MSYTDDDGDFELGKEEMEKALERYDANSAPEQLIRGFFTCVVGVAEALSTLDRDTRRSTGVVWKTVLAQLAVYCQGLHELTQWMTEPTYSEKKKKKMTLQQTLCFLKALEIETECQLITEGVDFVRRKSGISDPTGTWTPMHAVSSTSRAAVRRLAMKVQQFMLLSEIALVVKSKR